MLKPIVAVAGLGFGILAGLVVARIIKGSAGDELFLEQGGVRFWQKSQTEKLRATLAGLKATPHSQVERVWVLAPTGTEPALDRVHAIQQSGSVAATSPNLLDPSSWPKAMSQVTAAELMTFSDKSAAILPVL